MKAWRLEILAAVLFAGWVVGWLAFSPAGLEKTAAVVERRAPLLMADVGQAYAPPATATVTAAVGSAVIADADVAAAAELVTKPDPVKADTVTASDEPGSSVQAASADAPQTPPPPEPRPVQVASVNPSDLVPTASSPDVVAAATPSDVVAAATPSDVVAMATPSDVAPKDAAPASAIEIRDECLVIDICIDNYLWALYQRTPKEDTIKVHERRKVAVKRKGKTVMVTRTFTKLVDQDFTWKDPKAAEKVGMPMIDYVIGGMDRTFKRKLFHALRAADQAGLSPGITSAFRDDYRQSIASGLKAATERSWHGGSFRGGYGNGLAADVVSVKGGTRGQRWVSTEILWKWIDAHEREFGIGRPYLDRDPPHVAPIDGKEYVARRGTKVVQAKPEEKKPNRVAEAKRPGT